MYRQPMLMPLGDLHRARSFRQDHLTPKIATDHADLHGKIQTLVNEIADLQSKLRTATDSNNALIKQLEDMKKSVTAEKERRALAAFKKKMKDKKETSQKLREFLHHDDLPESDDE
tara:strand:- start:92 stop:439 length:348 start_codon:yes stop_codon:yes gene_type:complete